MRFPFARVVLLLLAAGVAGCGSREVALAPQHDRSVDFSGSWELHYGLSERLEEKIELLHLLARRQLQRQAQAQRVGPVIVTGRGRVNSSSAIVGLGRMAEMITRATVLTIDQDSQTITVERADDFPLTCRFDLAGHAIPDVLGTEACGWDGHQLVFRIDLPDGLRVRHRLTLAPNGQHLNIATTVRSRRAPQPFTLNRVYERFVPLPSPYECRNTLDRGQVCQRARRPVASE